MRTPGNGSPVPIDRLPPHSMDAEQGILACCLVAGTPCFEAASTVLKEEDFYDLRHRSIWQSYTRLHSQNAPIDSISVSNDLSEHQELEKVGGAAYLASLPDLIPSAVNAEYYTEILREHSAKRLCIQTASSVVSDLFDSGQMKVEDVVEFANAQFLQIAESFKKRKSRLPEVQDVCSLCDSPMLRPPEIVEGVFHQGTKLVLGGCSKSFKTWSLLDLSVSVATGSPWWGFNTHQGRVLYINLEIQPFFFRERVSYVLKAKETTLKPQTLDHWGLRGFAVDFDLLKAEFLERLKSQPYTLIVIDPTYKVLGKRDENAAGDIASLLNGFESLAVQSGAGVAFGAHFAKGNASSKDAIDRISGSGVFARDPDSIITLTKHEDQDAFTADFILRNLPPVSPFVVRWGFPLMSRTDLDPLKLRLPGTRPRTFTPDQALSLIIDHALTSAEWELAAIEKFNMSRSTFKSLKRSLILQKKILKSIPSGKWTPILTPSQGQ